MALFTIENLSFTYPGQTAPAIDRLTLTVPEGAFLVLCGPSGCGKSTFLRCLNRMNDLVDGCRITGKITIDDYNGLYSTNPRLSFVMMIALFSLAGIPPFAGFFSKFFIFAAAAQQGYYVLVFIALLNTIISLYYYLRVVKAMFINKNEQPIARFNSDNYSRISLVVCSAGILLAGILSVVYENIGMYSFGM